MDLARAHAMTRTEFIAEVERQCPGNLRPHTPEIIDIYERATHKAGKYYRADIPSALELGGSLAPYFMQRVQPRINRDSLLNSDFLVDLLGHWVRHIRSRNFGSGKARFRDYDSALDWMESNSTELDVERQPRAYLKLIPVYWDRKERIAYINPKPLDPEGHRLMDILVESRKMHEKTGFSQLSLVFYVLADIKPILPAYTVVPTVLPPSEWETDVGIFKYTRRSVTVVISSTLILDDLLTLNKSIRKELKITRRKVFGESHLELYRMVRAKGGPPRGKGTVAFWQSLQKEWNKAHHEKKYKHWKGLQMAYKRMGLKLSDRFQVQQSRD